MALRPRNKQRRITGLSKDPDRLAREEKERTIRVLSSVDMQNVEMLRNVRDRATEINVTFTIKESSLDDFRMLMEWPGHALTTVLSVSDIIVFLEKMEKHIPRMGIEINKPKLSE